MRTLVFSDIHGNLPAFEILLKREPADNYISLGDIVNYGPWSNECIDLIKSLPSTCIKLIGNHEKYFLSGKYEADNLAGRFFEFCYPSFDRIDDIKSWKEKYEFDNFTFQHTVDDRIVYPDSQFEFDKNYIIGHSHHQSFHKSGRNELYCIGSVGQNRQYINMIDYLIIDKGYKLKSIVYDESIILKEMKIRKYPQEFIDYYSKKARA